jgi:hypothetical protein
MSLGWNEREDLGDGVSFSLWPAGPISVLFQAAVASSIQHCGLAGGVLVVRSSIVLWFRAARPLGD